MGVFVKVKQKFYQDSLKLMRISSEIQSLDHITQAFAFMGTEVNKTSRIPSDVLVDDAKAAGPDDLILMVESGDARAAESALLEFDKMLTETRPAANIGLSGGRKPVTLDEGFAIAPDSTIAIISVPGQYAAAQAMRALQLGLNVHLFSDNVSLEDEIALKKFAAEKGLLLMGPDCGTSIIQGVPICFANKVKRGGIGIVGASGTGIQELSCIIDALGAGVSHAIGVGGRDLSENVGGIMTLQAVKMLADDPETKVLAIISKPPAGAVAGKVLAEVTSTGKPAVLVFMGYHSDNPMFAATLEEGAAKAAALLNNKVPVKTAFPREAVKPRSFRPEQKYIRGLYTGGTLAAEAKYIMMKNGITAFSIIDLGDDQYTRGALHPMIDPHNRNNMVANAIKDPTTAIVLCDVVIGYGSHVNPAGELAKVAQGACVLASVTGTDADPQNKSEQERILREAGITVFPSNQYAAEAACKLMKGGK
jgi:FdrA protein